MIPVQERRHRWKLAALAFENAIAFRTPPTEQQGEETEQ